MSKDLIKIKDLDFTIDCTAALLISIQRVIDEDRDLYRLLLTDPGTVVFSEKIEKTIRTAWYLIKGDIEGISDLSIEYIITGMKGVIRYWVTHDDMDIQTEAYGIFCPDSSRLHFGDYSSQQGCKARTDSPGELLICPAKSQSVLPRT